MDYIFNVTIKFKSAKAPGWTESKMNVLARDAREAMYKLEKEFKLRQERMHETMELQIISVVDHCLVNIT